MNRLPIDDILPQLVTSLRQQMCLVLKAPAGAGKTTRVPPALLDAGVAGDGQILLLQPRRLAARAAAARMSAERGTALGDEIGYQVRFERRTSRQTRIVSMTEGVFVRRMQDDPFLEGVSVVVFDEFHERSLDADLALAMVRRVQSEVRPELKIVVMSATLAPQPIAKYLGGCPTLESAGRTFPIETRYLKHARSEPVPIAAANGVAQLFEETTGDVLVFLPGVGEIRRTAEALAALAGERNLAVMELYADLTLERQQAVLVPCDRRKVVLATNVAETSITIDGVTAVVDTGLARINRIDSALGINRLELERISKASADQRAGRAGRTAPGICLRLWTDREQVGMAEFDTPEIERVDLAGAMLELAAWGENDLRGFPWYEVPPTKNVEQAASLLRLLGAIDVAGGVTPLGREMVRLPVHPRLARLLLEGQRSGVAEQAALVAAMLSERDPFRAAERERGRRPTEHRSDSDVLDRAAALNEFEHAKRRETSQGQIDSGAAKGVWRARDQLLRLMGNTGVKPQAADDGDVLLRAVFAAFADRLARRRSVGSPRAVMLGGRGVRLVEQSAVDAELFVCVELQEIGQAEALVRQASAVRREWLSADQLQFTIDVEFDPARESVIAIRRIRFEDLVIDEAATSVPADAIPAELLACEAAARLDLQTLLDDEARTFLARWQCLAVWRPDLQLPTLESNPLESMLPQLCVGCLSFDDLRKAPILWTLKSQLAPHHLAAIEREAPERIEVPSGSRITLQYEIGKPPVLAVRIQEIFGMKETPCVAGGRVAVLLHLLAPNQRPQQITSDLTSFWKNTYPIVRGELRRRYPKHAWPEDPYTALPECKPSKKGRT